MGEESDPSNGEQTSSTPPDPGRHPLPTDQQLRVRQRSLLGGLFGPTTRVLSPNRVMPHGVGSRRNDSRPSLDSLNGGWPVQELLSGRFPLRDRSEDSLTPASCTSCHRDEFQRLSPANFMPSEHVRGRVGSPCGRSAARMRSWTCPTKRGHSNHLVADQEI